MPIHVNMEQEVQAQGIQRSVKRRKPRDEPGERKYACSTCGKAFKHKHHRTEHERLHTGEKPFECEWCGKRFAHSGSYSQHRNQAWCKNAEGRDREKKKPRSKSVDVEKKRPTTTGTKTVAVLKDRQVEQATVNINNTHQPVTTTTVKTEQVSSKQTYPVSLNSQMMHQAYQHLLNTSTEQFNIPSSSAEQTYQLPAGENKDQLSYTQIAKLLQGENGAQLPAEFAQSASAWLIENANMQNMLDIHVNTLSQAEPTVGTSNVQYLYTIPGDQTTYCLSGIPYVNKVPEVQGEGQTRDDGNSGENSQTAYESYNIFNVQPRSDSSEIPKSDDELKSANYSIFNVTKTDAEKAALIDAGAIESSTAVSNLLGYESSQSIDRSQEMHKTEAPSNITSHLPTYEEAVKKAETDASHYTVPVKTEEGHYTVPIKTEETHYIVPIKTEDTGDIKDIAPPALIPASQLIQGRLPFPINVIQCVLCQEECADTNALVEHIKNKHYCQVADQMSSANRSETMQDKTPSSTGSFSMTSS